MAKTVRLLHAGLLLGAVVAGAAHAESALDEPGPLAPAPADESQAPRNRLVEEIIVTAQKREESLQSVPLSVQAFSADALSALGIDEPISLQKVTPGMQYSSQLGYSQIYIRGLGTDSFIPSSDATVATYIDGVYYPMAFGAAADFGAIERVEVLKGPQGTLFGRNSTGGAINVVVKQPGRTLESALTTTQQSHDDTRIGGYVNIPLLDSFAVSVAGRWTRNDSYYDSAETSPLAEVPGDHAEGFQLKARWMPGEAFDATLGYGYMSEESGTAGIGSNTAVRPLGSLLLIQPTPDYQTAQDHAGVATMDTRVTTLHLAYEASTFTTRLILADIDNRTATDVDFDGSPRPIAVITTPRPSYDSRTAELQILSNANSWHADRLTWIAGLYFIDSAVGYEPIRIGAGSGLVNFLASPGAPLLDGLTQPLIDTLSGLPLASALLPYLDDGMRLDVYGSLDTRSVAGFFQGSWKFTDALSLTLGGRYQTETRELGPSRTMINLQSAPTDGPGAAPLTSFGPQETDSHNFSPKVVLDFKLSDDALLYVLYTKGYKSGTYNIVNVIKAAEYVKPEVVDSYELGYKDTFFDGAMRFSAAAFENKARNVQGQVISFLSGGLASLLNNGSARIRGGEFETQWQLLPQRLPGLVLIGGLCYLDGRYTDYPEGTGYDSVTGVFFGPGALLPGRDFSGNRTVRTPEWSGNIGLSQAFALGRGMVEVAADYYYSAGVSYAAQNNPESRESAYNVVGARASYHYAPWNLRATLFGNNLTSSRYFLFLSDSDFATGGLLAPKAVYGLRLSWEL